MTRRRGLEAVGRADEDRNVFARSLDGILFHSVYQLAQDKFMEVVEKPDPRSHR